MVSREESHGSPFIPKIAYKTFFQNNNPSNFYIEFEKDDSLFFYEFSIKENVILKENLSTKDISPDSRKLKIFSRDNKRFMLNKKYFKNISPKIFPNIREDISLIAFIKRSPFSVEVIDQVYEYFSNFRTNINERGEINSNFKKQLTLNDYLKDPKLKKTAEEFIANFDIGLKGFNIEQLDKERGTQSLFLSLAHILSALKSRDSIVILDEIESGFHPEALNKLITYFINENEGKKVQMIFSSHYFGFMNKLDMHQIFLVDKNDKGESSVCRLNKIDDIRPDENFSAKYMSGAYGSFPKIRL